MDITKITLGELLSSTNEIIRRNAMSIKTVLQGAIEGFYELNGDKDDTGKEYTPSDIRKHLIETGTIKEK